MKGVPTVFTAERVSRIMDLKGSMRAADLAAILNVSTASLKGWCRDHGVSLARPRDSTWCAFYSRVRAMAGRHGYRFAMNCHGRVTLSVPLLEHVSLEDAERFLRSEAGKFAKNQSSIRAAMQLRFARPSEMVSPLSSAG